VVVITIVGSVLSFAPWNASVVPATARLWMIVVTLLFGALAISIHGLQRERDVVAIEYFK
jgi:hypothetical protein